MRHKSQATVTRDRNKTELIQSIHGCCFSPFPGNLLREIKNRNFISCPGLKSNNTLCYIPPYIATAIGYIDQDIANL